MAKGTKHEARPLVLLRGASVTRGGERLLFGVDFALEPGARWAVLGHNGAGKTTFLRLVRGDFAPDFPGAPDVPARPGGEGQRTYCLPGLGGEPGVPQGTPLGLRQRLAQVSADMQDAYAVHEWPATGLEVVLSGFEDTALLYAEPGQERRERASALLRGLGLWALAGRRMATLSTGEARKILLARALVSGPEALLLDECMEGLDASSRREFLALLDQVAAERPGLALLFSSHRQNELPTCLTQALVLRAGRIIWQGALAGQGDLAEELGKVDALGAAGPSAAAGDSPVQVPPPRPPSHLVAPAGGFLVRVAGASLEVGGARLLDRIDWTIRPGENWAVLGPNGAGKSTLLRLLAGQVWPSVVGPGPGMAHPDSAGPEMGGAPGTVCYGFAPGGTVDEARRRIGLVSAWLQAGFPYDLRVEEAVWTGLDASLDVFRQPDAVERERAEGWLGFFGLAQLRHRRVRSLSRGQLRRVLLARALVGNPALLLLDEPMAGLDAATRRATREVLERLARAGVPLVMVSHHERDLPESIDHVLALRGGRVAFCGGRAEHAAWLGALRKR